MERVTYISAGAGSGKTYTLTHLLADHIVKGDVEPEKVILTTYTKKAAAEFREKAKSVLYEEGRKHPELFEAAARLEQASIGTVHAVANSFVQKYWFYLGLSPQQKVIAEEDVDFYISQSLAELPTQEEIKFLNHFRNQFSIEKMRDEYNPAMGSYADYGFWKELLVKVIKKSETFGVTDLSDSREKSLELVRNIYVGNMIVPTEEEIKAAITELIPAIDAAARVNVDTRDNWKKALISFLSVPQELTFLWIKGLKDTISAALSKATIANNAPLAVTLNGQLNPWACPEVKAMNEKLVNTIFNMAERWQRGYEEYKSQNHLLDYDDMEHYMLELLKREDVKEDIRSSYEYLFVDEFQDSSPIQVHIFDELSRLMKKCYWVGDYKQAIYGFRGTDTQLVKAVVDTIARGEDGNHLADPLDTCWRSEPDITNVVNAVFVPVFEAEGLNRQMIELKPKTKKADAPTVNEPLCFWNIKADNKELAYGEIARRIAIMVKQGINPSDIAVLNSGNRDLDMLAEQLRGYNLPVRRSDGSIADEKEKQLLFSLLALLVNKNNSMAMLQVHYLTTPDSSLGQLIDQKLDDETFLGSHPLIQELLAQRKKFSQQSVSSLVESVIIEMDLYGESRHWDSTNRGFNILRTCIELARQYEEHCLQLGLPATISGYMNYIDTTEVKTEGDSDGVCLYTIHGSKGLEWKYVILTSLEKDIMDKFHKKNFFGVQTMHETEPSADNLYVPMTITVLPWIFGSAHNVPAEISQNINDQQIEASVLSESKRKLYVGMTRASEHLILTQLSTKKSRASFKWLDKIGIPTNPPSDSMERVDIFNSGHAFIIEEFAAEESHDALIYPSSKNTDKVLSLNISPNETHAPRDLQPSMLEGVADEVNVLLDEKRQRISVEKVDDDDTMAKVGTCVHDIFCAIEDNHNDQFVSSAILSHGMQQHLTNASSILLAWDWLVNFLTAQYGPATETWHERPFKYAVNGQIITGSIDLVWKTENGCVVIDYKTYPNWKKDSVTTKSDKHYAGNYKGQLDCYEQALSLNGENVIAKLIYYPVNGMIVQI